ncbi:MAG: hypothetical protein NTZ18_04720 [Candidatus Komeilibacteria bacterium]|nr:hypothetical protein [Candidatus Komeilibacteria bacterium]
MCGFNCPKSSKQQYAWIAKYFGGRALHPLYWIGYFGIRSQNPQNLTIYNGGSFLNSGREISGSKPEIPYSLQTAICRHVGQHPTIQKLFVESRPEFITRSNIGSLTDLLQGKVLQVGIGLESKNNKVRNSILRKGINLGQFENAVSVLKEYKAKSLAYVFFKPMELSEEEAIDDAVHTIQYCFEAGVDEVSLSCAFIQDGTKMADQYRKGAYQLPRLWSIIEVIKKTAPLGPVRIGTFEDDPPPIAIPRNCPQCTETVMQAIGQYRRTFNLSLFNQLHCPCEETWLKEISAQ